MQIIFNDWRKLSKPPAVTALDVLSAEGHFKIPAIPRNVHEKLWDSSPRKSISLERRLTIADLVPICGS